MFGTTKRVDTTVLADGTLVVRTPDEGQQYFAEARAWEESETDQALATLRAQGIARPVLFRLVDWEWRAVKLWRGLEAVLKARGIPVFSTGADGFSYVVPTDLGRELLRPLFGKGAARLFRTPSWPQSYFTVAIGSEGPKVYESRTFKDTNASEGE